MVSRFNFDGDAIALFTAAQITDSRVMNAVNNLILAAKINGWWDLCNAIYGFAGDGVSQSYASQYKYNWKDPQDTDGAFRLDFLGGGWTHGSTGSTPNGTTSYADTHLVPSSVLGFSDTHISYYSRSSASNVSVEIGSYDSVIPSALILYTRVSNQYKSAIYDEEDTQIIGASTDGSGLFMGSRIANNDHVLYRNGSSIDSNTTTQTPKSLTTYSVFLAGVNFEGTLDTPGDKECAFATIGAGINSTIAALMYSDIQTYQTALSRQV
jgi:hypothetical protein